ncbi:hypothetical protein [Opitutus sp. GAS368]|jgi:hypothetical protein|uniref:hypothetical protein n=1 Tax=Opitutus sp. GAS368 TaxID=1882749 RepID=UPI0012FD1BEB|nr:hypothetical protein [Opitutus sp. GAS368]
MASLTGRGVTHFCAVVEFGPWHFKENRSRIRTGFPAAKERKGREDNPSRRRFFVFSAFFRGYPSG